MKKLIYPIVLCLLMLFSPFPADEIRVQADTVTQSTDLDSNGIVDIRDLAIAAYNYNLKNGDSRWNSIYDLNNDNIIDLYDIVEISKEFDTGYVLSNFKNEHIEVDVLASNKIRVSGKKTGTYKYVTFYIWSPTLNDSIGYTEMETDSNGNFYGEFENNLDSGNYYIYVVTSCAWVVPAKVDSNGISLPGSKVYIDNLAKFKNQIIAASDTTVNVYSDADKAAINSLANEITNGITDDYDKVLAIHDWVAENIYYDYDMLQGKPGVWDAAGTLKSKRSVCQGYSELTAALTRSLGIPCKIIIGYGKTTSSEDWSNIPASASNHAWNEAYVEGRWVILDTTWDSGNKYVNGVYTKGSKYYWYFDTTIKYFSEDHRIGYEE